MHSHSWYCNFELLRFFTVFIERKKFNLSLHVFTVFSQGSKSSMVNLGREQYIGWEISFLMLNVNLQGFALKLFFNMNNMHVCKVTSL